MPLNTRAKTNIRFYNQVTVTTTPSLITFIKLSFVRMHNLSALLTFTLLSSVIIITRANTFVYSFHARRTIHTWIGNEAKPV